MSSMEIICRDVYARISDSGPAASWRADRDRTECRPGETAADLDARRLRAAQQVIQHAPAEVARILTAAGIPPAAVEVAADPDELVPETVRVRCVGTTELDQAETGAHARAALALTHDVQRIGRDVYLVAHLADVARFYDAHGTPSLAAHCRRLLADGEARHRSRAALVAITAAVGAAHAARVAAMCAERLAHVARATMARPTELDAWQTDPGDYGGLITGATPREDVERFGAWLTDREAARRAFAAARDDETEHDETTDAAGNFLPRGRCDTCGAPCDDDAGTCTRDRRHAVALDVLPDGRRVDRETGDLYDDAGTVVGNIHDGETEPGAPLAPPSYDPTAPAPVERDPAPTNPTDLAQLVRRLPAADAVAVLADALAGPAAAHLMETTGAPCCPGGFVCAECGTTEDAPDAPPFVVSGRAADAEGRTEVCLPCHEALTEPEDPRQDAPRP